MPSTHTSLHYHLIFSTKDRFPSIEPEWRDKLYAYLSGIVKKQGGVPLAVGGMPDHIHLLIGLKPTACLSDLMRELKSDSSEWIHKELKIQKFVWQPGYGAYTVSPSNVERVKNYVLHQERHHRGKTFQEEYIELLQVSGVEYDEQYLW